MIVCGYQIFVFAESITKLAHFQGIALLNVDLVTIILRLHPVLSAAVFAPKCIIHVGEYTKLIWNDPFHYYFQLLMINLCLPCCRVLCRDCCIFILATLSFYRNGSETWKSAEQYQLNIAS